MDYATLHCTVQYGLRYTTLHCTVWITVHYTALYSMDYGTLHCTVQQGRSTPFRGSLAGPDPHGREGLVMLQRHSCSAQSAHRPFFKYLLTATVFDDTRVVQGVNSFACATAALIAFLTP